MANPIANLTIQELQRAIAIRQEIDALEAELNSLGSGARKRGPGRRPGLKQLTARFEAVTAEAGPRTRKKRTLSPEARERIAAAQRARWAKTKGENK
jgi:hypothetical protein